MGPKVAAIVELECFINCDGSLSVMWHHAAAALLGIVQHHYKQTQYYTIKSIPQENNSFIKKSEDTQIRIHLPNWLMFKDYELTSKANLVESRRENCGYLN